MIKFYEDLAGGPEGPSKSFHRSEKSRATAAEAGAIGIRLAACLHSSS